MESVNILLIAILVLLCIGFVCMYIILIKLIREVLTKINNKTEFINDKLNIIFNHSLTCINRIQELNKTIYEIYDNHIKVIENYTKYCATNIARKHKSNKNKTNTKQQ